MKRTIFILCILVLFITQGEAKVAFYSNGSRERPQIAITVDDWFEPGLIPDFLDLAALYSVHLTLYPIGEILRAKDSELWQRVLNEGHEIGNHTYSHTHLTEFDYNRVVWEIQKAEKRLDDALGYHYEMNTLRMPGGRGKSCGSESYIARAMEDCGYQHAVFWIFDENDADTILKKTLNGSIILLHANRHDLKVLSEILPVLSERGYEMVTVSALLGLTKDGWISEEYIPEELRNSGL